MPKAAPSRCTEPQCWNWAVKEGKCEWHQRQPWQTKSPRNRIIRDRTRWQRVRSQVLRRDKFTCYWCGGDATEADHLISPGDGGAAYDLGNLVASCHECNAERGRQLAQQKKRANRKARRVD